MKTLRKETREEKIAAALYGAGGRILWHKPIKPGAFEIELTAWKLPGRIAIVQYWPHFDAVEIFWPSKSRTIDELIREINQD